MIAAPGSFEGSFSNFFARWVEPNLPSPLAVAEFDAQFRDYLEGPDPLYILRKLPRQKRGELCVTNQGARILPADNSPGWWLHARLISAGDHPDAVTLFDRIPTHFFKASGLSTLNGAGFHLAHVIDVSDGNSRWEDWDRSEAAIRMLRNLHPCNWFLLAKPDWRTAGANPAIIAWVEYTYAKLYGEAFKAFRRDVGKSMPSSEAPPDPLYSYSLPPSPTPKQTLRTTTMRAQTSGARGGSSDNPRILNRPAIRRELQGDGIRLLIRFGGRCYNVAHDDLVEWVGENANALNTDSWRLEGHYSWPNPSAKMRSFLSEFEVRCPPD
jgi:hypothetical protein